MENVQIQSLDPETEFLVSNRQTGNEWELYKENVRPLKRGRNINLLNDALKSHSDNQLRKSLFEKRRKLVEAIDGYQGDDPLLPWLECIKWVQEAFPSGGDYSGLLVIYEKCVRTFWHEERYKNDLRYLKVWLEYAENCHDAEVIYTFLDANEIGKSHAVYYIAYALHMESKNKMKAANEIFNLGISRNAQPLKKLEDAYRKFIGRSMRKPRADDEEQVETCAPVRSFGTVLARGENIRQTVETSDFAKKNPKANRASFSVYKDKGADHGHLDESKKGLTSWDSLGSRADRNKENIRAPSKWTSCKIPQRPGVRTVGATPPARIEVFVDEDCAKQDKVEEKVSAVELRQGDGKDLKKETELLRENPLRNFPLKTLPR